MPEQEGVNTLSHKQETEQEILDRLCGEAGHLIEMFRHYFSTPQGVDLRRALVFTAALAGHACHRAVKAENGTFAVVTDRDGKNYYFGDDLNRYLLENSMSVAGFCTAVTGLTREDVLAAVAGCANAVGSEDHTVCGYDPGVLYREVSDCWDGIFDNMTARYCKTPSEWPVLYGIVLQNFLMTALDAGAPEEEAGRIALVSAVYMSKLDRDSF